MYLNTDIYMLLSISTKAIETEILSSDSRIKYRYELPQNITPMYDLIVRQMQSAYSLVVR